METTQNTQIQYQNTQETSIVTIQHYDDIEFYRRSLFKTQILSFGNSKGLGYGNMSKRARNLEFVITASKTGQIDELLTKHYVHVKATYPAKGIVETIGFAQPSRDVFTHYHIYETRPDITHIFHGHHIPLWNHLLENDFQSIPKELDLGSDEYIDSVKKLISNDKKGIFALEGHEGGFISYADDGRKASRQIKRILKQLPAELDSTEIMASNEKMEEVLSTQGGEA